MKFSGTTYDVIKDKKRLTTQLGRVREFMEDCQWHTLHQLTNFAGGSEAGVSARLRDLRNKFSMNIERRRVGDGGLWEYRLVPKYGAQKEFDFPLPAVE